MASRPDRSAYRIVSNQYPSFDGGGAHRWGSRWVSPGCWVVHAAQTYALALLENLVHWQTTTLPPTLVCVEAQLPATIAQEQGPEVLPSGPGYAACREIGDDWYRRGESAVLWVPSVVSPFERNVLFNQRHDDFRGINLSEPFPVQIDERLLR